MPASLTIRVPYGALDQPPMITLSSGRFSRNCLRNRRLPKLSGLLCSDGLTDMCDDQTIYRVLSSGQPDMANELMQLAMDAGGVDNTTLILIEVL